MLSPKRPHLSDHQPISNDDRSIWTGKKSCGRISLTNMGEVFADGKNISSANEHLALPQDFADSERII
jgi:hypothetical protein